ncbi:MAG: hypothetical protein K2G86_07860 [Prevotella sp.]|nr:hypothetical protein [Prevotella sp.]
MNFNEVIGQEEIKERLMKMCREDRVPHAMMFCGPRGCGKMALAMAFACYLLEGNFKESEVRSEESPMLANMRHPDLHFSYPTIKLPSMSSDYKPVSDDFAREWHEMIMESPYFTMDRWMQAIGAENQQAIITAGESDALTHKLSLKSSQGVYKVAVIWMPERMNIECANKMLKLIEEPPSRTIFIMVSDEPQRVLETIRSRAQRIDIRRIDDESMVHAIAARRGLNEEEARRVTRMAAGDWNNTIEISDSD